MRNSHQICGVRGFLLFFVLLLFGCSHSVGEVSSGPPAPPIETIEVREEVTRLRELADQEFQMQHYIDAFILIGEALQKARTPQFPDKDFLELIRQEVRMRKDFVYLDESPLMHVFKDSQIPIKRRQALLYILRDMLINQFLRDRDMVVLLGKEYHGTFVQILTHPQVDWEIKEVMLISIEEEILKQEPGYLPEIYLGYDKEFLFLWEQYQNELKKKD